MCLSLNRPTEDAGIDPDGASHGHAHGHRGPRDRRPVRCRKKAATVAGR